MLIVHYLKSFCLLGSASYSSRGDYKWSCSFPLAITELEDGFVVSSESHGHSLNRQLPLLDLRIRKVVKYFFQKIQN